MGRPLPKKFIGNTTGAGSQIVLNAWLPGGVAAEAAYVVKQLSTRKFIAADPTNTRQGIVVLQDAAPTVAGQAQLLVTPFVGPVEHANKIGKRFVETFADHRYTYVLGVAASAAGQATVAAA